MDQIVTATGMNGRELRRRATPARMPLTNGGADDECIAGRSDVAVLITAVSRRQVEALARRIHHASLRASAPFVPVRMGTFPTKPRMLRARYASLLDAAAGGSVLLSAVEEMPSVVQEALIEVIDELQRAPAPSKRVRLMSGTTVPLVDRVAAGTFSEQLFYRLNLIHLVVGDGVLATRQRASAITAR